MSERAAYGAAMVEAFEARAFCYRCHKAAVTCICAEVPRVQNRTHVRLVQHPREQFHPIGTARIARLGLADVAVEVLHERGDRRPACLPDDAGLLYPGVGARDLASLAPNERPSALVVVDGTWAHARTLVRDNRWLRELPRYRLRPPASRYRIRREPSVDAVSTIEAIVEALKILEPETEGLADLLATFEGMIDRQLAIIAERAAGKRKPASRRLRRGNAGIVVDEPERLVLIAGEAAASAPQRERLVMQWAALRVATGERFERFARPPAERFPVGPHLAHMGLTAALVAGGGTLDELRVAWRVFVRPTDVVVSWTQGALSLLAAIDPTPRPSLQLKSLHCSRTHRASGSVEAVTSELALPVGPPAFQGRAGRNIAHLEAVLDHLRRTLAQG